MGCAISKLMASMMMFAFPSVLKIVFGTLQIDPIPNSSFSPIANAAQNMAESMVSIMGTMAYVAAIVMLISAIFAFKKESEGNAVYTSYVENVNEKDSKDEKPIESIVVVKNNLDFENEELNKLVKLIKDKAQQLKGNSVVKSDMESLLLVEKSEYDYIKKIHDSYMSIPSHKRKVFFKKRNPFDMAKNQLNMLLEGLDDVENKIVEHAIFNQQVNEKFLKEKMTSI